MKNSVKVLYSENLFLRKAIYGEKKFLRITTFCLIFLYVTPRFFATVILVFRMFYLERLYNK